MTETIDGKLLQEYEDMRRREVSLFTDLLDILPRIENYEEQRIGQVRDAMFHADHPFMMVFVGAFSSGKSSLINALLGTESLLRVGVTPTTDRISILRYGDGAQASSHVGGVDTVFYPSPLLKKVSFVDTPGLESVFREHEDTTRKFLHRADVVLLTMLATQAMTQSNLETLKFFKEYGKKVILVINQIDLVDEAERDTLRQYVQTQSRDKLGFMPEIWLVSAKLGSLAWQGGDTPQPELWLQSGLAQFTQYIEKQLSDVERLRQKLHTPLQIARNAHQSALEVVSRNQGTFDQYRTITENIDRQLESQRQELGKITREVVLSVESRYKEAITRSKVAIGEVFHIANTLRALRDGVLEMTFLAWLFRAGKPSAYMKGSFEAHKVFEPLDELHVVSGKLAPRIEGQDMKDVADLVTHGQREMAKLPTAMQSKLIGNIQAPSSYNRTFLTDLRKPLEVIETASKQPLLDQLNEIRRNTLLYFGAWQVLMIALLMAWFYANDALANSSELPLDWIVLGAIVFGMVMAVIGVPLRGQFAHTAYANALLKQQTQYIDLLTKASDLHIDYAMQMRRESISPLTRLIEAQTDIQAKQFAQLKAAEQTLTKLDSDLNALGRRKILGITL